MTASVEIVDNILSLRFILQINDIDCVSVLAEMNNDYIETIEKFIKHERNTDMISQPETIDDYLGRFKKTQKNFAFSVGQKILLNLMVRSCKSYVQKTGVVQPIQHSEDADIEKNAEALESARKLKKKNLESLYESLLTSISSNPSLNQIHRDEFDFKVMKNSYKHFDDGTITCGVKCTTIGCNATFAVSYKRYPSSYKPKKKDASKQQLIPPRWYHKPVIHHLVDIHSTDNRSSQDEDSDSVTDLTTNDVESQTVEENQTNQSHEESTSTQPQASSSTVEKASRQTRTKRNFRGFSNIDVMSKKPKRS